MTTFNDHAPQALASGELRVLCRLAWNGWTDSEHSRNIIAEHEARDTPSRDAWDRVIAALDAATRSAPVGGNPLPSGERSFAVMHGSAGADTPHSWQPIKTAPKDGEIILVFGEKHGVCASYYGEWHDYKDGEDHEGWVEVGSYDKLPGATHWQPLPAAPDAAPVPQSAAIAAGLREKVALEIWHRWADSGTLEWAEETHQAEYLLCADAILALVVAAPNASPEPDAVREALRELYIWWDRDGSVGSASEIFERHRAAVDTALARHDRGSEAR